MEELHSQGKSLSSAAVVVPVLPIFTKSLPKIKSKPIDVDTAVVSSFCRSFFVFSCVFKSANRTITLLQRIKMFLFGTSNKQFTNDWLRQSFSFSDIPKLAFNIIQNNVSANSISIKLLHYLIFAFKLQVHFFLV